MPTSISAVSADPEIFSFWAGASIRTARPVAEFLAPRVVVQTMNGFFKRRTKDSRLIDGTFLRMLGGEASQVDIAMQNVPYNTAPFALDYILDKALGGDLAPAVKDGINLLANLQAESTERAVIRAAIASAGDGTPETFTNADPVEIIDALILSLMKSGASQQCGVLFDPIAWGIFKNNSAVTARAKSADLTYETTPGLFQGNAQYRTAYSFFDANPLGASQNIQFVMPASTVLIFTRPDSPEPSLNDPAFMKRFVLDPDTFEKYTGHAPIDAVETQDGRKVRVVADWSEDVQVTNLTGAMLLNIS